MRKLGLLDWPVDPVRTRRRLAMAAWAYVILGTVALGSWAVLLHVVSREQPPPLVVFSSSYPAITAQSTPEQVGHFYGKSNATHGHPRVRYEMINIPAGPVIIGSDPFERGSQASETPAHTVEVQGFSIDKYEVTNEQYYGYVRATGAAPPACWGGVPAPPKVMRRHPVIGVTYAEAEGYARWAGKRLPTEAEWVRAARGDTTRVYPWGHVFGAAYYTADPAPAAVGTVATDRSLYGVCDMANNAAEWTCDPWATFPGCPAPEAPDPQARVVKGCFLWRCAARHKVKVDEPIISVGIRCVKDG